MFKRSIKILFKITSGILCLFLLYLIAAYTVPLITVNNDFRNGENGIKLFVVSNGVHTDVVLPAKTPFKDWTLAFPKDSFDVKDSSYSYIAFGWGDKGFYLNTPNWSDLTFSTAFNAAFGLSETAIHVRYLKERKKENENCVQVLIDTDSYVKLITYIEKSFQKKGETFLKISHPGYGRFDRFFEAKGTYSLFYTCNVWTNFALKEINVRTALWSPFSGGLMHSLRP